MALGYKGLMGQIWGSRCNWGHAAAQQRGGEVCREDQGPL